MRERWREWWQARNTHERALIVGGGGALAVALLWAYVWVPLEADRSRLTATLPTLRTQAQPLALQAGEVERLRTSGRGGTAPSQSAIEHTSKSAGLGAGVVNISMLGGGRVQVNLDVVPFDTLVGMIAQLAESHGLAVETIALNAVGEPGKVRVETLVLQGARS
jgi:type II secretory pathway component PulM